MGLQKGRPSYAKDALKYQPLLVAVLLPWSSILWKKAFWKIDLFCVKLIKHTKKTSEQSAAEKGKCMVIWFSVDSWSFCDTIAYKVGQRLSLPHSLWPTLCSFVNVVSLGRWFCFILPMSIILLSWLWSSYSTAILWWNIINF